ncbi:MAG: penicillin-binding protein 1C [Ignavibacteriae bacterium]|nr:penicillin-binding protein 1C [Ignavibacteriota bacterium]NOG99489.1 penicillin-binding protein 1C [Ignavibacteriota bacterium]
MRILIILVSAVLLFLFWFSLPDPLFTNPHSIVVEDKNDKLLGAIIAEDGQWRFPLVENVPDKFVTAITHFEDKNFFYHPGVNPFSIIRAAYQNIEEGKIVSGGSTITMQVIRLSRQGKPRTFYQKFIEMILAVRLELSYSKNEILALHASHSPFGGNVVGIEAASWRYFGRTPENLSWAETCMLAVLPNSPSLIHPGKNRILLKAKRDRLLNKLLQNHEIDSLTYDLSLSEPLPEKPLPLPKSAPHLTFEISKQLKGSNEEINPRVKTTIDEAVQQRANAIIQSNHNKLKANQIFNAAAIVAEIKTGNVIAYVGNTNDKQNRNENWVDVIMAPRSSGSILKPILFAAMLTTGELLPKALLPDIPTQIGGFSPQNFNLGYDGAIPADKALARSINIPAVRMLKSFRTERFYNLLTNIGMTTLNRPASNYGLSLILGGAEVKLWDIAGIYASMARSLNNYSNYGASYYPRDYHPLNFIKEDDAKINEPGFDQLEDNSVLNAASLWITFNTMIDVERPDDHSFWRQFASSQKIAWKTGTSFGFRDAWAIGLNKEYVVAVWAGNADGEGRTGLIGITAAAPILFEIFNSLPYSPEWFEPPYEELVNAEVCAKSGYRVSEYCTEKDSMWIPRTGLEFPVCPYHKLIHLDGSGKYRVTAECEAPTKMMHKSWFVLPPAMEYFYKSKDFSYKTLPSYRKDCLDAITGSSPMDLIYPRDIDKIYIPIDLVGTRSSAVFEVAHRQADASIFWHLDDEYLGQTQGKHRMPINAEKGEHKLTLVDMDGNTFERKFEVLSEGE